MAAEGSRGAAGASSSPFFARPALQKRLDGCRLPPLHSSCPVCTCALQAAAQQGDTAAPPADEEVDLHFVAFVCVAGALYELDGRKAGPINHGPCAPERLLEETARVVRANFIERSNSIQARACSQD